MTTAGNSDTTPTERDNPTTTSEGDCYKDLNSNKNLDAVQGSADGSHDLQ